MAGRAPSGWKRPRVEKGESGFPLARGFRGGQNLKNQGGAGLAGDAGIDRLMHAMALKKLREPLEETELPDPQPGP